MRENKLSNVRLQHPFTEIIPEPNYIHFLLKAELGKVEVTTATTQPHCPKALACDIT